MIQTQLQELYQNVAISKAQKVYFPGEEGLHSPGFQGASQLCSWLPAAVSL